MIPLTKTVNINNAIKPKKWYDDDLGALKREKIARYKEWSVNKLSHKWTEYVNVRNDYNRLIKYKKDVYTKNEINKVANNQRAMWNCLNKLITCKNTVTSDEIIFEDGAKTNANEIAEKFNEYFIKSIIEINSEIPTVIRQFDGINDQCETTFKFKPVDTDEIIKSTRKLTKKINKSDLCNSRVWDDSMEYCAFFMSTIINESLSSGYFPKAWKTATVTPIPKIKNTKQASEHRPINSMPNDEKIIENL